MASINGLHVKNLKKFRGHEGEPCYQGDLYLGKTKIGFWSQDTWGCIVDNFDAEPGFSEQKLNNQIKELNKEKARHGTARNGEPFTIDYDLTILMTDYLGLSEDEKLFKKAVKNGYTSVFIITDQYRVWAYMFYHEKFKSDKEIVNSFANEIEAAEKKKLFKDCTITTKIYRSLDEFNIGAPISLDAIRR